MQEVKELLKTENRYLLAPIPFYLISMDNLLTFILFGGLVSPSTDGKRVNLEFPGYMRETENL